MNDMKYEDKGWVVYGFGEYVQENFVDEAGFWGSFRLFEIDLGWGLLWIYEKDSFTVIRSWF